eukprot:5154984-Ditylum_brightwellii.AAC.1
MPAEAKCKLTEQYPSLGEIVNKKILDPLFGRTVPATNVDTRAIISYFKEILNATHFGVLYVNDQFGTSFARSIQDEAGQAKSSLSVTLLALPVDASEDEAAISLKLLNET